MKVPSKIVIPQALCSSRRLNRRTSGEKLWNYFRQFFPRFYYWENSARAGGLVGFNDGNISGCYFNGSVTSSFVLLVD